jgi:hypothetical protein
MRKWRRVGIAVGLLGAALGAAWGAEAGGTEATATASASDGGGSAGALPVGSEPVRLDPADFSLRIDNPYYPLAPGDRRIVRETDVGGAKARGVVSVTRRTKRLANGVTARVVNDRVREDGEVVEDAREWYAQDSAGNVWYFGEDTVECKNGKVARRGGFEAGVGGAQPGVIMPADPQVGLTFRKAYDPGNTEDVGEVLSLNERAEVPFGKFRNEVLLVKETSPLEPDALEYALYAKGVGPVLVLQVSGGSAREELLRYRHGRQVKLPARRDRCG